MIRIGLTGTLAAGKSTVGGLFEAWGASRVDADTLARRAVEPGSPGLERLRGMWGDAVLDESGALDRDVVRAFVFEDREARAALEDIVHREVARLRDAWRHDRAEEGAEILVEEIPLLFERGLEEGYDAIVVVDAPVDERRRRAVEARGWSADEFDAIEATQMEPAEKRARADHVVDNDGDRDALARSARQVWDAVLTRSQD